jgi:hypothetical protein
MKTWKASNDLDYEAEKDSVLYPYELADGKSLPGAGDPGVVICMDESTDARAGDRATANNVELAYVPFYSSWLNRIESPFTALRHFALNGTGHPGQREQASIIRRYIAWRNNLTTDPQLRKVIKKATLIKRAKVA